MASTYLPSLEHLISISRSQEPKEELLIPFFWGGGGGGGGGGGIFWFPRHDINYGGHSDLRGFERDLD